MLSAAEFWSADHLEPINQNCIKWADRFFTREREIFGMTDTVDLSLAEGVYLTLLDAQYNPIVAAADLVRALKAKIQNSGNQSHEIEMAQADAWPKAKIGN